MIHRAVLPAAILMTMLVHADAQFGDMPGMPGSPGTISPGAGFGAPSAPPPQCMALLSIRDDLQKRGEAISAANQKKADVKVACRLFRDYIATEGKMLKMLETDGASCGVPPQIAQQVRGSHAKAQQLGKQVCEAAGRQPFRDDVPPSLRDLLPIDSDRPRPWQEDILLPPKPLPRREPWPTRLSERR